MADPVYGSPEWVAERRSYLGASEVAAALGLNPFSTPLDVFARKCGPVVDGANVRTRSGHSRERMILDEYAENMGATLTFPGTLRHPSLAFLRATPDALATVSADRRLVEAKAVGRRMASRWDDGPPEYVLIQAQVQMAVCEIEACDVAALLDATDAVQVFPVERDDALITLLVEQAGEWWQRHIVGGEMPEPTGGGHEGESVASLYRKVCRPLVEAPDGFADLAARFATAREMEKVAADEKDRLATIIKAAIADGEGYQWPGGKATWKPDANGKPAWKAIAESLGATPELIAEHTPEPGRVLRVSLKGAK